METAKQRIAIDMDEVVADTLGKLLHCYNRDYEDTVTIEDLHGKKLRQVAKCGQELYRYFDDPTFFRDLAVMPDSQDVIRELQTRYEIFIASAAMEVPASFAAKYEWLKEHFPFIPDTHIVFCGDKSIINADYLIDDHTYQFARFRGQGILYTASHNLEETRYPRVNNWRDVADMFLK
ncbi:5' nucleotidase, NT5C type [Paenibacillus flagellatus]|uniref:5'-3'-deoxyribonucleotidase n=1 Tax=Paenibacillus flagellatus TaxID=2211139 RepID=A0A2V5KLA7_9BACL|nr:5'-3'-deoxyribonucleotidase [Paenibacillus flagellatus]PYI51547.1 5'-3'-deoxyribonucleotidase [Paenibacillus flagellatus]